jgi:hypothetical protein
MTPRQAIAPPTEWSNQHLPGASAGIWGARAIEARPGVAQCGVVFSPHGDEDGLDVDYREPL